MAKIEEIEGIDAVYAKKFEAVGVATTDDLLKTGGSAEGRAKLAERVEIDSSRLLAWVNRSDLMRINGVGSEFSDLLEAAGVDTVRELAARNPENLHSRVAELNEEKHLVRRVPSIGDLEEWVSEARSLPVAVTH